jgi:uncharacterized membrane protein
VRRGAYTIAVGCICGGRRNTSEKKIALFIFDLLFVCSLVRCLCLHSTHDGPLAVAAANPIRGLIHLSSLTVSFLLRPFLCSAGGGYGYSGGGYGGGGYSGGGGRSLFEQAKYS